MDCAAPHLQVLQDVLPLLLQSLGAALAKLNPYRNAANSHNAHGFNYDRYGQRSADVLDVFKCAHAARVSL